MAETKEITLELTPHIPELDPEPAKDEIVLTTDGTAAEAKAEEEKKDSAYLADVNLTDAEKKTVADFAEKINLKDSNIVLTYGAASQKKISDFADTALSGVKTKDLGEVGTMISSLVGELKGFSAEDEQKKGFFGFMKKKGRGSDTAESKVCFRGSQCRQDSRLPGNASEYFAGRHHHAG